ncbi:translation initiation factor IF-2-like isoform X2 [Hemicordylus capensis]|uniref:translation initiation factor IF-2-like isoform X2 n=1 Tax=Hemicordylus capensis TaxID=884348 RepID=UPI00230259B2|nr:translation initiation factor IF-2-like isoform X2 [Hemicordylus capensis]
MGGRGQLQSPGLRSAPEPPPSPCVDREATTWGPNPLVRGQRGQRENTALLPLRCGDDPLTRSCGGPEEGKRPAPEQALLRRSRGESPRPQQPLSGRRALRQNRDQAGRGLGALSFLSRRLASHRNGASPVPVLAGLEGPGGSRRGSVGRGGPSAYPAVLPGRGRTVGRALGRPAKLSATGTRTGCCEVGGRRRAPPGDTASLSSDTGGVVAAGRGRSQGDPRGCSGLLPCSSDGCKGGAWRGPDTRPERQPRGAAAAPSLAARAAGSGGRSGGSPLPSGLPPAPAQARTCLREGAGPGDVRGRGLPGLGSCLSARLAGLPRVSCSSGLVVQQSVRPSRRSAPRPAIRTRQSEAPRCPATPSRPWRVHAAAIPPSAMARPLQDGSRAEPTAAVSGSPAFPMGGTVAVPPSVCQPPFALPPGLNCTCRWESGQDPSRSRASEGQADQGEGLAASTEPEQRAAEPNGHLPRNRPSLEQEIGARLRHMGDQFHREHERRPPQQPPRAYGGALWGHLGHLVFQLLGALYNLPAEGMAGLGPQ